MASLRQRGKKKTWYALFRDATGLLVERSCGKHIKTRQQAQEIADKWEQAARPKPEPKAESVKRVRRVLAEMHKKMIGEDLPAMSVNAFLDQWLALRREEISPDSYKVYEGALAAFKAFMGKRSGDDLFTITKTEIAGFRDYELKLNQPTTVNKKMKVLRMIFKTALDDGWIAENPMKGLKLAKNDKAGPKETSVPFTVEQLKLVLAHCPNDEWKAMVIRGYYSGQRLKDIALMTRQQEDVLSGRVHFTTHKSAAVIWLQMHPAYQEWALALPSSDNPNEPLHPNAFTSVMERKNAGKAAQVVTLSGQFARILADAGLRPKAPHTKKEGGLGRRGKRKRNKYSFHSLRSSFVSHLKDAGVTSAVVQDMVGHESAEINALYTMLSEETKREAMAKLPNIIG